jgi:HSP20 family protein
MRSAGPEPAHFPFEDSYPGEDWVRRLQAEIGRIFQMAYASRHSGALNLIDRDWRDVGEMPSVNMRQEETNYVVAVSMPGADKAGINVSLNGRLLKIEAGMEQRETERNAEAISSGRFQTQIMLPDDIIGEAARAVYENSILKITIPRKTDGNSLARKVVIM